MDEVRSDMARRASSGGLGTPGRLALAVFAFAAAYFLWTEHRAHMTEYLPWGILALCPLMHLFMHRGHGGHGLGVRGPAPELEGPSREP